MGNGVFVDVKARNKAATLRKAIIAAGDDCRGMAAKTGVSAYVCFRLLKGTGMIRKSNFAKIADFYLPRWVEMNNGGKMGNGGTIDGDFTKVLTNAMGTIKSTLSAAMPAAPKRSFNYGERRKIMRELDAEGVTVVSARHNITRAMLYKWHGEYSTKQWDGIPDDWTRSTNIKKWNKRQNADSVDALRAEFAKLKEEQAEMLGVMMELNSQLKKFKGIK